MSKGITDNDPPNFAVDLGKTPRIHVYGTETGGILEVKYVKPSTGKTSQSATEPDSEIESEIPREKYVAREWGYEQLSSEYRNTTIAIFGDGNVIGNHNTVSQSKPK